MGVLTTKIIFHSSILRRSRARINNLNNMAGYADGARMYVLVYGLAF